eukprot:4072152-Prymnesium_polylepis.1
MSHSRWPAQTTRSRMGHDLDSSRCLAGRRGCRLLHVHARDEGGYESNGRHAREYTDGHIETGVAVVVVVVTAGPSTFIRHVGFDHEIVRAPGLVGRKTPTGTDMPRRGGEKGCWRFVEDDFVCVGRSGSARIALRRPEGVERAVNVGGVVRGKVLRRPRTEDWGGLRTEKGLEEPAAGATTVSATGRSGGVESGRPP